MELYFHKAVLLFCLLQHAAGTRPNCEDQAEYSALMNTSITTTWIVIGRFWSKQTRWSIWSLYYIEFNIVTCHTFWVRFLSLISSTQNTYTSSLLVISFYIQIIQVTTVTPFLLLPPPLSLSLSLSCSLSPPSLPPSPLSLYLPYQYPLLLLSPSSLPPVLHPLSLSLPLPLGLSHPSLPISPTLSPLTPSPSLTPPSLRLIHVRSIDIYIVQIKIKVVPTTPTNISLSRSPPSHMWY